MRRQRWIILSSKMDLARLVLARQPIAKLNTLSRLIQSSRFQLTWIVVHGLNSADTTTNSVILELSTTFGELSTESITYVPVDYIIYRSIFLREWRAFQYFSNYESGGYNYPPPEFWYGLESGIPEIQAFVLANGYMNLNQDVQKFMHQVRGMIGVKSEFGAQENYPMDSPRDFQRYRFLRDLGDSSKIPWTPKIKEILRDFVRRLTELSRLRLDDVNDDLVRIEGALQIPRTFDKYETRSVTYKVEFIKSILGYMPSLEKNEEADRIYNIPPAYGPRTVPLVSGYYFPLIEGLNNGTYKDPVAVLEAAFNLFAYDLIHYLIYTMRFQGIITDTRSVNMRIGLREVLCARRCLSDNIIISHMDELLITRYRVIAGDVLEDVEAKYVDRIGVYNPGPIISERDNSVRRVVQGSVAYDPKATLDYGFNIYRSGRYLMYLRGQGFIVEDVSEVLKFPDYPTETEIDRYPVLAPVKQKILEIRASRDQLYQTILTELVNEKRQMT